MQFFYNQGKGDMDSLEIHELNQEKGEENVRIRNNVDVSGSSKKRSDEMKRNKEYFVELPIEESYGEGEDEIINYLLNEQQEDNDGGLVEGIRMLRLKRG